MLISLDKNEQQYQPQPMKPIKIRLAIGVKGKEQEIFAIPCPNGPKGTPKTVKWLIEEAQRRYNDLHKVTVSPCLSLLLSTTRVLMNDTCFK